jgi:hypothetical protein
MLKDKMGPVALEMFGPTDALHQAGIEFVHPAEGRQNNPAAVARSWSTASIRWGRRRSRSPLSTRSQRLQDHPGPAAPHAASSVQ